MSRSVLALLTGRRQLSQSRSPRLQAGMGNTARCVVSKCLTRRTADQETAQVEERHVDVPLDAAAKVLLFGDGGISCSGQRFAWSV